MSLLIQRWSDSPEVIKQPDEYDVDALINDCLEENPPLEGEFYWKTLFDMLMAGF